jgi:hypothetical protein
MPIVNLPAFFDMVYTNKDGKLSPDGHMYNDQMFQVLNNMVFIINGITTTVIVSTKSTEPNVTIDGLNPPSKTTVEITAIVQRDIDAIAAGEPIPVPYGTMWYNSDMNKLQFLGVVATVPTVQTITST